ncbi:MAG TPA: translocation/assembly module TamB domain-containing protein, partial [Bryobacteraceae bacterium]
GDTMHADAELAPLSFAGSTVFTDGFRAHGGPDAAFADLRIEQIRTEISLRRFFEKVWQVEQFDVQRVKVDLEGPRADRPPEPTADPLAAPKTGNSSTGWLPNRVEVGHATIHDTDLNWKGGGLHNTVFEVEPREGGWQIAGQGGHIAYAKLPQLDVNTLRLRYHAPSLFINSAELRQPSGGTLEASGEIDFTHKLDVQLKLTDINIAPYLSEDWRVRAKGNVSGDITIRSDLPMHGGPQITGSLHTTQGELTALPVLDEIAVFTRTQQFRHINLNTASGDFTRDDNRLDVKNFIAESQGLIRVEGAFTIENGTIDGTFQVGVTASSLQWLPGSQTKVFTESRSGYVWAPMRLTGPANKPNEDLSPRLIAAAQGAVIEGVQDAAGKAVETGKGAVKGALDLLLPLTK